MCFRPALLGWHMLGLWVMLFALYLTAGLLGRARPSSTERHLGMVGFCCLTPGFLSQRLPLVILPVLVLMLAGYLYRAR